jgi:hypothetical protein
MLGRRVFGACIAAAGVGAAVACGDGAPDVPRASDMHDDAGRADASDGGSDDAFAVEQTWYLERDATTVGDAIEWTRKEGVRATLVIGRDRDGVLVGTVTDDGAGADRVDAVVQTTSTLAFRRRTANGWQHYMLRTTDGVALGRYAKTNDAMAPSPTSYDGHVSGWSADAFPLSGGALSWNVALSNGAQARIRIARDDAGAWSGRFKIYAGATGEQLEEDAVRVAFDGVTLAFEGQLSRLDAVASGRTLDGFATTKEGRLALHGARSALASFGVAQRGDRTAWQSVTRRRIAALMMNGDPTPPAPCTATLGPPQPPRAPSGPMPPDRDDDFAAHTQDYALVELTLSCPTTNPFDDRPIAAPRAIHGWVAVPNAPAPHPVVLAINGHGGTALSVMTPDDGLFYYGDAYARRGFLVVAIDVKHHPDEEIAGEDGTHAAIIGDGFATSDWEEDGERVWDLRRASDWIFARGDIDASRALVTGLSMGGEETALVAALDDRWKMAVPAGYSPDMDVLLALGGHNCWQWKNADIIEWLDQSDLHALVAPRALLVETGRKDMVFSVRTPPFSGDLQVMRRTRTAWTTAEQAHLGLYLHYDVHAYHFGDRRAGEAVGLAVGVVPPATSPSWQTDDTTTPLAPTLFDVAAAWL